MLVGTSSKILWSLNILDALSRASDIGYRHVEIWAEHIWRDDVPPAKVATRANDLELSLSVHASSADLNITARNVGIRNESVRQTQECIRLARDVGAGLITVHPGRLSSTKDDEAEYWPLQIETFQKIADFAEDCAVNVAVENMEKRDKEFIVSVGHVQRIVNEISRPNFGITFDIAHAYTYYGESVLTIVDQLDYRKVFNIHISNSGEKTHLPLDKGDLPLRNLVTKISAQYNGMFVIEGREPEYEFETAERNLNWFRGDE